MVAGKGPLKIRSCVRELRDVLAFSLALGLPHAHASEENAAAGVTHTDFKLLPNRGGVRGDFGGQMRPIRYYFGSLMLADSGE
jgi:hypothetical protein